MTDKMISRRAALRWAGFASAAGLATVMTPNMSFALGTGMRWDRTLLLIRLAGGNDGLNTIVPYTEQLYYQYRPTIGLSRSAITPIDSRFAFNNALTPLLPSWNNGHGDMTIALGMGYPGPNDSHFKSTDIWNTAVPLDDTPPEGWIARLFDQSPPPSSLPVEGVVIGDNNAGPLIGQNVRTITGSSSVMLKASTLSNVTSEAARNAVYSWMVQQQQNIDAAAAPVNAIKKVVLKTTFPTTTIGKSLAYAAQTIVSGIGAPVITVTQATYDTHVNQIAAQTTMLTDLAAAIAAFRAELIAQGAWNKVLVMTTSEFGRAAYENSGKGTDHGQGNVQFLLGGAVKGGYIGAQAPLTTVTTQAGRDALAYQLDFRQVLATIMQSWWNAPASVSQAVLTQSFKPLSFLSV